MAYSRFSYADVYVFMSVYGSLECCGCWLGPGWNFGSTQAMIDHLAEHRAAGHSVPEGIEDALRDDDAENFPPQCTGGHDWGEVYHPYGDNEDPLLAGITCRKCTRCHWTSG